MPARQPTGTRAINTNTAREKMPSQWPWERWSVRSSISGEGAFQLCWNDLPRRSERGEIEKAILGFAAFVPFFVGILELIQPKAKLAGLISPQFPLR